MGINPFQKTIEDVSDASDWQDSKVPLLSELDSLKRCYICKEFFRAPLITSCNHTFCSHCIREYLINNSKCPLCNVELFESNLKRDILLEEIVSCYVRIRPKLLKELKLLNFDREQRTGHEHPTSGPNIVDEVIEISSEGEQINYSSSPKNKRIRLDNSIELVECPVCHQKMAEDFLQTKHIDNCLEGKPTPVYKPKLKSKRSNISSFFKQKENSSSQSSSVERERSPTIELDHQDFYFKQTNKYNLETKKLPKLDFQSLTTPKLKEKLTALKLPTTGTRSQLELRYNHFYVLFNSNLDSSRPIDEKVLRQNLNKWELSHLAFNHNSANLFSSRNSLSNRNILDKNFSIKEWNQAYNHDFKILVRQAKASIKPKIENSKQVSYEEISTVDSDPVESTNSSIC